MQTGSLVVIFWMCLSQKRNKRVIEAPTRTMKATKPSRDLMWSLSDTLKPLETCRGQTGSKSDPQTSRPHFRRLRPHTAGERWEFRPHILSVTSGGAVAWRWNSWSDNVAAVWLSAPPWLLVTPGNLANECVCVCVWARGVGVTSGITGVTESRLPLQVQIHGCR